MRAGATTLFSQTATLDATGERTSLQDSWGTSTFGYDPAGRLTSASYPDGSTEADQYDPAGNRTVITGTTTLSGTVVTTNQYDAADELTSSAASGQGTTTYSYDGDGNQLGSVGPTGVVTDTYNLQNQLVHVSGPGTNVSYVDDGQGDRLRSMDVANPYGSLRNDAQDLVGGLSTLASDGAADYAYLTPGSGQAPLSGYNVGTARTTYLGTDLLGSVRVALDPHDAVLGAGGYDAWGTARAYAGTSGPTLLAGLQGTSPFGYAGQYYDGGPGMYSMRAREYSPQQGRFVTVDPLISRTGQPYVYAEDAPTIHTDPSGDLTAEEGDPLPAGMVAMASEMAVASQSMAPSAASSSGFTLKPSDDALVCAIKLYQQAGYTVFVGGLLGAAAPQRVSNLNIVVDPELAVRLLLSKGDRIPGPDFIAYRGSLPGNMDLVAVEVKQRSGTALYDRDMNSSYNGLQQGTMAWVDASTKQNCRSSNNIIAKAEGCFWQNPYDYLRRVCGIPQQEDGSLFGIGYLDNDQVAQRIKRRSDLVVVLSNTSRRRSSKPPTYYLSAGVTARFSRTAVFTDGNINASLSKNPVTANCPCRQNDLPMGVVVYSAPDPHSPGWPQLHERHLCMPWTDWCLFGAHLTAAFAVAYFNLGFPPVTFSTDLDLQYDDALPGGEQHFVQFGPTKTYANSGFLAIVDVDEDTLPHPDAKHMHRIGGTPVLVTRFHFHNFKVDGQPVILVGPYQAIDTITYNLVIPN